MPQSDVPSVTCTPESESAPVDPESKADLECLSRIESVIAAEKKKKALLIFFRFWLRLKMFQQGNGSAVKLEKKSKRKQTLRKNNTSTAVQNDSNAFDIFNK